MRGTMLWFNETKESGVITAETGERLAVRHDDFTAGPPEGRCSGRPVEFELTETADGLKAERVVLLPELNPRRARRRSAGHRY
jgi:cold shock CspA family protein